ncbi:MAG: ABA4-like family protein [Pseudomonadota bacterium]
MTLDQVFDVANTTALVGWIALLFAPLAPRIIDGVAGYAIPTLLCVVYTALIILYFGGADGGFDTLDNVVLLFTREELVLVGWVHFLAFDLFIGGWIVRTARGDGMPFWLALPCLPFALMLGPVGLLMFLAIRAVHRARRA